MTAEWPEKPASPDDGRLLPPWALLWRGLALASAELALLALATRALRASRLLAPFALLAVAAAVLSAWGAAVHVTGGVKHDDHELV